MYDCIPMQACIYIYDSMYTSICFYTCTQLVCTIICNGSEAACRDNASHKLYNSGVLGLLGYLSASLKMHVVTLPGTKAPFGPSQLGGASRPCMPCNAREVFTSLSVAASVQPVVLVVRS